MTRGTWNGGLFEVARSCSAGQRCLGNPRVFSRRALGRDERRDLAVRERVDRMAIRVDEDGFGGEACMEYY